ncbi:hypothetical protein MKW94_028201 [Papaver nudicaule]|uniref:Pentatricopeptide repeat-containing protein n=1 Tax=Papaver nudicaule TaxID=74823 RepID=A0AA42AW65_PAPNU|nr:hypothetical protein [Papaver nudicaule]
MRSLKRTFLWMKLQWGASNYGSIIGSLKKFSSSHSGENLDIRKWNKKISNFVRNGQINEARRLFDTLQYRNTVTWNSMISGYVKNREILKARKLFDEMPQRDVVSWNLIISGYVSSRGSKQIEEARYLFDQMPVRDKVSWNTLISGYARNGKMNEALDMFSRMSERDTISWNTMITGFLQNGDVVRAMELFKEMPQRDSASISAVVSGLIQNGKLDEAAKVLFEIKSLCNGEADLIHAYNTLMAGYGQCGRIVEARRLFDHIPSHPDVGRGEKQVSFVKNVVSWNSMMMCYIKVGDLSSARELFDDMLERDVISWNTMISAYAQVSNLEEAAKLFYEMPNPDSQSWNSMISGYALSGDLELARNFFDKTPNKSLVSWNSMISGYEQNGEHSEAVGLFQQLLRESERPDKHTLSAVLSACAGLSALHLGMQIHQLVMKLVIADIPINNSLITMYSRCGVILDARSVFDEMTFKRDVVSWNSIIGGYAYNGFALEALKFFEEMKSKNVKPTHITFVSVLSACAHAGLVEEGRRQFKSMVYEYGIEPLMEHFASLVDVVGRNGYVEEAMDLIKTMPYEPDRAVWGALLGACRIHNNVDFAKIAAEALMKLEPESSAPYVMLHSMYADAGRWEDATRVRTMMQTNKIKKQAAFSWIGLQ